jgi:hypothetical protein
VKRCWLKLRLVVAIDFWEWALDNRLRHASYSLSGFAIFLFRCY